MGVNDELRAAVAGAVGEWLEHRDGDIAEAVLRAVGECARRTPAAPMPWDRVAAGSSASRPLFERDCR